MPPDTVAVKVTCCPAAGLVGLNVKLAVSAFGATVTDWPALFEAPVPLAAYVCITWAPFARIEPSPKFQLNEYGAVPPVAVAVNVTGLPTVGLALTVNVTVSGLGVMAIVLDAVCLAPFASVTLTLTVKLPLTW